MSRATAVLVPASLNLGVASVLAPVLNALLARSVEPEASIGGYALALSVMMFVALPHARVQALALVFLDNQNSLRRRSEEHTSELQSLVNLVCRLLL